MSEKLDTQQIIAQLTAGGASLDQILAALMQNFAGTVGGFRKDMRSAYEEAMESIRKYYDTATEDTGESFQERFNLIEENLGNLGLDFANSDLANQWDADQTYLQESADQALANDLAWFEKMKAADDGLYNAMLTDMAAAQILAQASGGSGGGSGGSGGGRGGRGGGSSSGDGDWDETTSITTRSDYERTWPGFVEAVQALYESNQMTEDQWALANNLIDRFTEPKDIIQEITNQQIMNQAAADEAQAIINAIDQGQGGQFNLPKPVGDGTFTWVQRDVRTPNEVEGIERVTNPSGNINFNRNRFSGQSQADFLRNNRFVLAPDEQGRMPEQVADELDAIQQNYREVMSENQSLRDAARAVISDNTDYMAMSDPLKTFVRQWDPIRGWVNTEETADEYWRTKLSTKNQPAPTPIDPLNPDMTFPGGNVPLIQGGPGAFAGMEIPRNRVEPVFMPQWQKDAQRRLEESPSVERMIQAAINQKREQAAIQRAAEQRAAQQAEQERANRTGTVSRNSGGNVNRYPSRPAPVATENNPHPMGTGTFGQPVRTATPFYVAAPKKKPEPRRKFGVPGGGVRPV
jgi:hypothetical protein